MSKMSRRYLFFLLILGGVAFSLVSCKKFYWQKFHSKGGGFRIEFPAKPAHESKQKKTPFGPLQIHTYMVEKHSHEFAVALMDFPEVIISLNKPKKLLDNAVKGMIKRFSPMKVYRKKTITLQKVPGVEVEADGVIVGSDNKKIPIVINSRLFLRKNRLYQVHIFADAKTRIEPKALKHFFSSFRFQ